MSITKKTTFINRLIKEKSPYLLQHAHNPVDWYPWSAEAFDKAEKEKKPIFLSIGYSTCHWCHVMEEESFENEDVAKIINEYFVAIKVDREERPDIDSIYMKYLMATTRHGGWPMSVFLTPEKKPFFGGTYFPPQDQWGIPGFKTILSSLIEAWQNRQQEIINSANSAKNYLAESRIIVDSQALSVETITESFHAFEALYDSIYGGFGQAPKFPRSHVLSLILRYWYRAQSIKPLEMIQNTLQHMADSGLYDQLGGGFHRYSVDNQWRIPHFEKMLYDQALLVETYLEAYQITKNANYARVARETLDYVLREMTAPEGGFYSAQDADSIDLSRPGKKWEGAFYLWKKKEIIHLLELRDAEIFIYFYGITEDGNALSDPHHEFQGYNVLYRASTLKDTATYFKKSEEDIAQSLSRSRQKIFTIREQRPAPHLDDKILTDWNGLMIAAFANAAFILKEPRYRDAAERAAHFIEMHLMKKYTLLHRFRSNDAAIEGNLNDYAFFIYGLLAVYETTFHTHWLELATKLADTLLAHFMDVSAPGFFLTTKEQAVDLIARPKEYYDGAIPAGNSVATLVLLQLERFTGHALYREATDKILQGLSGLMTTDPSSYPFLLQALDFAIGPTSEVVLSVNSVSEAEPFLQALRRHFIPNKITLMRTKKDPALGKISPFTSLLTRAENDAPSVYLCQAHTCQRPIIEPAEFEKILLQKHISDL
ncbi:MAG: thioredoxin domain-containing protein [Gammaproteobacteria bacterium]